MSNRQTVAAIYDAFARDDIPFILEQLSDDVEWEYGPVSTDIPFLQPSRGREGAARFFTGLGDVLQLTRFEVTEIVGDGPTVVALCTAEGSIPRTGVHLVEEDEAHIWRFNDDGRVARFRHRVDTHQLWMAYHEKTA